VLQVSTERPVSEDLEQFEKKESQSIQSSGIKNEEEINPVSLPAFMKKTFDGRDLKVGEVLAVNESYTRYFVTYKSGDLTISGIMNVPKGDGPFPVAILNHGYIDTAVYTNGRGLKREQDYLARNGFVVIHSDYRNHAQSDKDTDAELTLRLGYTEDVINVILAAKNSDLSYLDTENFVMLGHSMGGGVTENILVVQPNLVKAAVLFAPVSADYRDNFNKWTKSRTETAEKIVQKYGSFDQSPGFWDNISPINFIDRISVPIMNHHGTDDESVPLEWSVRFDKELTAGGKDATLYIYEGEKHEFINQWPLVMARTVDFFQNHIQ